MKLKEKLNENHRASQSQVKPGKKKKNDMSKKQAAETFPHSTAKMKSKRIELPTIHDHDSDVFGGWDNDESDRMAP